MTLEFRALPTDWVDSVRNGAPDANGQPAERHVSDGIGTPCRHCLQDVPKGAPMLVLAARPFPAAQPYAETGPIFLCADRCEQWSGTGIPPVLQTSASYLVRGYGPDDRIVYGTGRVVARSDMIAACSALLAEDGVSYIHVRSASNNCYQAAVAQVDKGGMDDGNLRSDT